MVFFACPYCGKKMRARLEAAGSQVRCQACSRIVVVPQPMKAAREEAAPVASTESPSQPTTTEEGSATGDPPTFTPGPAAPESISPASSEPPGQNPEPVPPTIEFGAGTFEPPPVREAGEVSSWEDADEEEAETEPEQPPTEYAPLRRPISYTASVMGLIGAALLAVGGFYPLVDVQQSEVHAAGRTVSIEFAPFWIWPVRIGAILIGVTAIYVIYSRQYVGFWILGVGTLGSLGMAYFFFFHYRLQSLARSAIREAVDVATARNIETEIIEAVAAVMKPGQAFWFLGGGAAALILAAILSRRSRPQPWQPTV